MMNRLGITMIALVLLTSSALASPAERLLSLVPPDAVSVAMVRVDDMRRSPIAQHLFERMRTAHPDADAERLLREAGLRPAEDVDTLLVTLSPSGSPGYPRALVVADGRFDPVRLGKSLESRGAVRRSSFGVTYFLAPENEGPQPAFCFWGRELVVAGTEEAVLAAIGSLLRGEDRFATSTLGYQMFRIPPRASGWVLFDVQRARAMRSLQAPGASPFSSESLAAVKDVSFVSLWVAETGERLEFGSAAVAADPETRTLVEDLLKGMLASLRLAAQQRQPEMVKVVRRFVVRTEADAVSLSGSVPTALARDFIARLK